MDRSLVGLCSDSLLSLSELSEVDLFPKADGVYV